MIGVLLHGSILGFPLRIQAETETICMGHSNVDQIIGGVLNRFAFCESKRTGITAKIGCYGALRTWNELDEEVWYRMDTQGL